MSRTRTDAERSAARERRWRRQVVAVRRALRALLPEPGDQRRQ